MTTDELRDAIFEEIQRMNGESMDEAYQAADRILAIPEIAEALAQKAYAERMMSHSTGGSSEQTR